MSLIWSHHPAVSHRYHKFADGEFHPMVRQEWHGDVRVSVEPVDDRRPFACIYRATSKYGVEGFRLYIRLSIWVSSPANCYRFAEYRRHDTFATSVEKLKGRADLVFKKLQESVRQ